MLDLYRDYRGGPALIPIVQADAEKAALVTRIAELQALVDALRAETDAASALFRQAFPDGIPPMGVPRR